MTRQKNIKTLATQLLGDYMRKMRTQAPAVLRRADIEPLHQMRVYSRRLRSAFSFFKELFPRKKLKKFKKKIRALGRALGEARQLDVQILFIQLLLRHKAASRFRYGFSKLIKTLQARRQASTARIESVLKALEKKRTFHRIKDEMRAIQRREQKHIEETLREHTRRIVRKKVKCMLDLSRSLTDTYDAALLHKMRICAKQLRYALEIAEALYGARFKAYTRSAKDIQDVLGDLHEYDVWLTALPQLERDHRNDSSYLSAIRHLRQLCLRERLKKHRKFRLLWKKQKTDKVWQRLIGTA